MSGLDFVDNTCCKNPGNCEETMRRTEGNTVYVWYKCNVCEQTRLSSSPVIESSREVHEQQSA